MDYQQIIQRHIAKITIGVTVVGITSFTVWYYNSHKTEQEPYVEQVPSSESTHSIQYNTSTNETNPQTTSLKQNDYSNDINDTNEKNDTNDTVSNVTGNELSENEPTEQITVSPINTTHVNVTENKKDQTDEKVSNNNNVEIKSSNSEQVINENTEMENEKQNDEIYQMSDETKTHKVSAYKAKFNAKDAPKIRVTHSDEYTKQEMLEIHARNEHISKEKRKVGRLNKDSFRFMENNNDTRKRGTSTPRKELKEDTSWVKLKPRKTSHVEHPSVMELNVSKLVTDAKIIGSLTPITDQKASTMSTSMKPVRTSRKSNRSSQKQ